MTSILFIQSSRPHGNIAGQEGLDAIMMGSAFTECGVLFAGDAVLQLVKNQDTAGIATRNYAVTYGALKDYGVGAIYCDGTSLERYNLALDDLSIDVTPLDGEGMRDLLLKYDRTISF